MFESLFHELTYCLTRIMQLAFKKLASHTSALGPHETALISALILT
jgi:hypothetical protein